MNPFDLTILHFLNAFAHQYLAFDAFIALLNNGALFQGGFIMALFWWAWMRPAENGKEHRETLLCGFGLSVVAIALARGLALSLPFRERPLRNPLLHFQLPYDVRGTVLEGWSSFPSDHAVLFFCLAAILWRVSRRLGLLAYLHAVFVVMLPLVYTGLHYPSDIVAGAVLGYIIGSLVQIERLRISFARPLLRWCDGNAAMSYVLLFAVTFECGEMFSTVRSVLHAGFHVVNSSAPSLSTWLLR